jgi:hypothetical protein
LGTGKEQQADPPEKNIRRMRANGFEVREFASVEDLRALKGWIFWKILMILCLFSRENHFQMVLTFHLTT